MTAIYFAQQICLYNLTSVCNFRLRSLYCSSFGPGQLLQTYPTICVCLEYEIYFVRFFSEYITVFCFIFFSNRCQCGLIDNHSFLNRMNYIYQLNFKVKLHLSDDYVQEYLFKKNLDINKVFSFQRLLIDLTIMLRRKPENQTCWSNPNLPKPLDFSVFSSITDLKDGFNQSGHSSLDTEKKQR